MRKWNNSDRNYGPLTISRNELGHGVFGLYLETGTDYCGCGWGRHLWLHLFWIAFALALPCPDARRRGPQTKYGFSMYHADAMQVFWGATAAEDGRGQQRLLWLPFLHWRYVSVKHTDLSGRFLWQEFTQASSSKNWRQWSAKMASIPRTKLLVKVREIRHPLRVSTIAVLASIEITHFKLGLSPFKWVSLLWPDHTNRRLDVMFGEEIGPGKGSWKGGTLGVSSHFPPGETVTGKLAEIFEEQGLEVLAIADAGREDRATFEEQWRSRNSARNIFHAVAA